MNLNLSELKELIVWAKSQKIKSLKLGETIVEFSDYAFIAEMADFNSPDKDLSVPPKSPRLPDGNAQSSEDDEDLFWSSRT